MAKNNDGQRPLAETASEQIIRLIIDEPYPAGARLPNEYELAARMGVGRSTVREAVRSLVSRNVLEVRHGSGTYVAENIGEMEDPLGFRFWRNKKRLALDLCQIRLFIEPELAASAAQQAGHLDMDDLQLRADAIVALYDAAEDHTAADIALHVRIAESSGNLVAPKLVSIIATAIPLFIQLTRRDLKAETIATHQEIVDAIRKRNSRRAKQAMTRHIEINRDRLMNLPDEK